MSWNRLINCERKELCELPVWTTEEDRRRALSYADHPLEGTLEAVRAVSTGAPAPKNLGLLVAVARYEDAGWMPDGCFERWRRWGSQGTEQLDVGPLVQWLEIVEGTLQGKLNDLEERLTIQCHDQNENMAVAEAAANRAHQLLHTHHRQLILARLSIGDTEGARKITQRAPAGSARDKINKVLHEHSALSSTGAGTLIEGTVESTMTARNPEQLDNHSPATKPLDNHHQAAEQLSSHLPATNVRQALHRLHLSSQRAPDIQATPMRLVREDAFKELLAAANIAAIPAPHPDERAALEWLKQLMGSIAYRGCQHRPVLVALANRLLESAK